MKNIKNKFNNFLSKRVILLFIIFTAVNLTAILPSINFISDIFSHFIKQYLILSFLFLIIFAYLSFTNKKFLIGVFASIIFSCMNFGLMYSATRQTTKASIPENQTAENLSLGIVNVLTSNTNYEKLLKIISEQNSDILILQEIDSIWLQNIKELKYTYPYYLEHPRDDNFGIAIYSKIPLTNSEIEYWTNFEVPVIKAEIKRGKNLYTIYGVHTLPPISKNYISTRNEMLSKISNNIEKNNNVIVGGDLNTTIYSHAYRKIISQKRIQDAQTISKNQKGTWNTKHLPFFRISLEHVLYKNSNIQIQSFECGANFDSDHFPVFVNLNLY